MNPKDIIHREAEICYGLRDESPRNIRRALKKDKAKRASAAKMIRYNEIAKSVLIGHLAQEKINATA